MTIEKIIDSIEPIDRKAMEEAGKRWNSIAKPLKDIAV